MMRELKYGLNWGAVVPRLIERVGMATDASTCSVNLFMGFRR